MEDHEAIPILRQSHKRALEFFNKNEFKELAYGLPKKIEQNALASLKELEDKNVPSQFKFTGDPKQGTLKRSDRQNESGIQNFSAIESLPELEALGGIVTDINGYAYPINKLRCIQQRKGIRKALCRKGNHSAKRGAVQVRHYKKVKKSELPSLQVVSSGVSNTNKSTYGEKNNYSTNSSLTWNDILNRYTSNTFFATESNNDEEPLPDINSFSDTAEVLAMFEDQT